MIVTVDRDTQEIILSLPEDAERYRDELTAVLLEEFAFEPQSRDVIIRMNQFAADWCLEKGIVISEEENHTA